MKSIFITGASSGLGKATAKLFAAKGWNVIATMRNPEKETELVHVANVTLLPLDVTQEEQIKLTVQKALELHDIDVVFNNAGYGLIGPLEAYSNTQIERQLTTNFLGVVRVTQAFIPHFRAKKAGLFLTTTSIGGLVSMPLDSIYHATKWALEGWSESMSFELGLHNIQIKTVAPGGIITDFGGRSIEVVEHPSYAGAVDQLMGMFNIDNFSTAEQIADVVYEAATDGKYQLRYVAGEDAKALYERRLEIGQDAMHQEFKKNIFS
ncbi:short-chain dehydrogenase/reductase [Empedobacter brevis NBRC 14943 = ATCC 43319]|uniref:Short-chain dehydrogenase/reductase n=1 Tax=Empedobacter brevis NBRC 14943 = ATCC 43319 TaxID=1218108 RepID=A0A511NF82_9FLAO|nr:SDR family oxidoreductase [Empedobacter brevis]GEM51490.1 short-chain dehydrogenase/reductase [Empedobacter brevis NBRC 14943 = ATCC 43319]